MVHPMIFMIGSGLYMGISSPCIVYAPLKLSSFERSGHSTYDSTTVCRAPQSTLRDFETKSRNDYISARQVKRLSVRQTPAKSTRLRLPRRNSMAPPAPPALPSRAPRTPAGNYRPSRLIRPSIPTEWDGPGPAPDQTVFTLFPFFM
jgi:hypothetical protein